MLINKNTKIGKILKANPEALEHIIAINPIFEKLRNPILRKLMANRTSIAMAAKVGNIVPEDFFNALKPLGFEFKNTVGKSDYTQPKNDTPFDLKDQHVISMDVRPILAKGKDPLHDILTKVKELKTGEILKIINTFEPTPLIKMLEKQGFQSYVKQFTSSYIETYFRKTTHENMEENNVPETNKEGWGEVFTTYKTKLEKVDVRNLEMPLPMTTILESLDALPEDKALFVVHKKVPVYLLPELSDRNFDFRMKEITENEYHILIYRK